MTEATLTDVRRLEAFLIEEAALLDSRRYAQWLDLLDEDFIYRVPVPLSREDTELTPYDDTMEYANESKSFLQMRFDRIRSDFAWAERPVAYTRHFVTNLRVLEEGSLGPGSWTISTNVLVVRSRLPEPPVMSTAERRDVVIEAGGRLLLRSRTVYLDTEVPNESQLGVIH